MLCAALLHDTIEDTDTSADKLRVEFGSAIADIVLEVSDDKFLAKQTRKDLQVEHAQQLSAQATPPDPRKPLSVARAICGKW